MSFADRREAAERLVAALEAYRGRNPLVLAIPRGAVPMGEILANGLGGDLDVVLVRKIGAPGQPEYALGAVDETGRVYLHPEARHLRLPETYWESETKAQMATLARRRREYTPQRPPLSPAGRVVIVVDDGLATGSTMIAALTAVRAQGPIRLIAATAVAPPETAERLKDFADEVVCLERPPHFQSVGQFFDDFSQVDDGEVMEILNRRTHAAHHRQ